ncbi:MAG: sigma-70 family RNA polymerase sigma factor [Candidatus Melainabacteria bacterium]|nr:sigma-70 family RNA polymerase sigma factor [Candidatus Melainabacteria bacterium]
MRIDFSENSDLEIVELCQLGKKEAFQELVKRYQKNVFALLYQLAPEWRDLNDLSQEVFIRVYRGIHNLRNPKIFKSWLNQIVLNLFYDELRKRPRRIKTVSMDQTYEDDSGENEFTREAKDSKQKPDEVMSSNETRNAIKKAMAELPEQFRTAIVLRELQGLQYEEIAELLGCALGTVKSRIWRARERLQVLLEPFLQEAGYLPPASTPLQQSNGF